MPKRIKVIDSHTGGEPTRIIVEGGPDLADGSLTQRLANFRDHFDEIRNAVVNEPRGSDVLVGGLLCEPTQPEFAAGVIFFNNTGYLGMCGHGTIGLMVTLHHLGRIAEGSHRIETPVGPIVAHLQSANEVSIQNVRSFRHRASVSIDVPGYGTVVGDVAWGGNWFFLVKDSSERIEVMERIDVANSAHLIAFTKEIRDALQKSGITGTDGALIDHIELFGPAVDPGNNSRSFVLCPGGAYDRSPCGTGLSAKLACLAADGKLAPGEIWNQESIVGSLFSGSYEKLEGTDHIVPSIRGTAYVCGESTLILDPADPFCMGIRQ